LTRPLSDIAGYHAHIYYTADSRSHAEQIREEMERQFSVILGRWHDQPVGPHPSPMFQVIISTEEFGKVVPWLNLNRGPLDILIHPETGNDLEDHTTLAIWLGKPRNLDYRKL
jgi:aromatic ring-cleaving dioxygenase